MPAYFKPLRRKIGVVTLMMACLFAAGWVRSLYLKDEISVRRDKLVTHHLISNASRFGWKTVTTKPSINLNISFFFTRPADDESFYRGPNVEWKWRRQFFGFEFGRFVPPGIGWVEDVWIVPYWSIVIPMTILSVWLLLSKPRVKTRSTELALKTEP